MMQGLVPPPGEIEVTLVCNAGLLLRCGGTTLLLDGVFGPGDHPFSYPSQAVFQDMCSGRGHFAQVDYLLFTHVHPDHFSPSMTLEYLKNRPVKGVFKPQADAPGSPLDAYLTAQKIPHADLSQRTDHTAYQIEPGLSLRAFSTRHLGEKYWGVRQVCYLLSFGEKHIYFTADADYTDPAAFAHLTPFPLRAVFMNPLFFHAFHDRRFFPGGLTAQSYWVYHVPFAPDDSLEMRRMVRRDLLAWPQEEGPAQALTEPWQRTLL